MNCRTWSIISVFIMILGAFTISLCVSEDSEAADSSGPIEMTTHFYLDKGDGSDIEKFDSDKTRIRDIIKEALGSRVVFRTNGQIVEVDKKANDENKNWAVFVWSSPNGWGNAIYAKDINAECPQGTNIALKYSTWTEDKENNKIYEAPDIDVKYTVFYFLKWEKWTKEYDDNPWMRAIYDQIGWEAMREGFWIYGNGSMNNEALIDAIHKKFFSDKVLTKKVSEEKGKPCITWYIDGEQVFQHGITDSMYGWFLDFLGWGDTKDSSSGSTGYGTWTYWAQYRYDLSKGVDDYNNWSYNQLSFGLYDITKDRAFGLWLQTTSDEPAGTIEMGLPADIRIDKDMNTTTETVNGVKVDTTNTDILNYMGKVVGSKKTIVRSNDDGSSSKTVETYDVEGKLTESKTYTYDSSKVLVEEEVTTNTYGNGKLVKSETVVSKYTRDSSGNIINVEKTTKTDIGGNIQETTTDVHYHSGYNISIEKTGDTRSIVLTVADKGDLSEAISKAKQISESYNGLSIDLCIQGTITSKDLKIVNDAGLRITMNGNEGRIVLSSEVLRGLDFNEKMDFKLTRDITTELELAEQVDEDNMSKVGEKYQVFTITLMCDDKEKSSFGVFEITLNYVGKCESKTLSVWRLDGNQLVYVGTASYNAQNGMATFEADHLSTYILSEKGCGDSSSSSMQYISIAAVIAVVVIAGIIVVMRR